MKTTTALLASLTLTSAASALELIVDDQGILWGAKDVVISGKLYDVEFLPDARLIHIPRDLPGHCPTVFNGCDSAEDFFFTERLDAIAAAQALLNQVLIDGPLGNFDSSPEKVANCAVTYINDLDSPCAVAFPYYVYDSTPEDFYVLHSVAFNFPAAGERNDNVTINDFNASGSWVGIWAIWSDAASTIATKALTISPPTGRYASTQDFDLVLFVERDMAAFTGISVLHNGAEVSGGLTRCWRQGTADAGGSTYRCPISSDALLEGDNTVAVSVDFSDGPPITDSVTWTVDYTHE